VQERGVSSIIVVIAVVIAIAAAALGGYYLWVRGKPGAELITLDPADMSLTISDMPTGWRVIYHPGYSTAENIAQEASTMGISMTENQLRRMGYDLGYAIGFGTGGPSPAVWSYTFKFLNVKGGSDFSSLGRVLVENIGFTASSMPQIGDQCVGYSGTDPVTKYAENILVFRKVNVVVFLLSRGVSMEGLAYYARAVESRIT
jgi:hypothetical protein